MEYYDMTEVLRALCKATEKWGLFISFDTSCIQEEVIEACSFLDLDEHRQIIFDGIGYFLFDTEEELWQHYKMCIGEDGPTELNNYNGPLVVYALTVNNLGEYQTVNT